MDCGCPERRYCGAMFDGWLATLLYAYGVLSNSAGFTTITFCGDWLGGMRNCGLIV
jgi:hypothetical protein